MHAESLPRIAAIIPFFQRKPGFLADALKSIFEHKQHHDVKIIIVDDGSPVPVEHELSGFSDAQRATITVIRQHNQGVAAARNAGLDAVDASVDVVAFLDADDAWTPGHVQRIATAFAAGADYYFSDAKVSPTASSRFEWMGMEREPRSVLDAELELWWYEGNFLDLATQGRIPVSMSTVAFRRAAAPDTRFSRQFHRCSEDHFFHVQLTQQSKRIAYSTALGQWIGQGGIGLSSSATWGTVAGTEMIVDAARHHCLIQKLYRLSAAAVATNQQKLSGMDVDFYLSWLAVLKKIRKPQWSLLGEYLGLRPLSLLALPRVVARLSSKPAAQQGNS